MAKQNYATFLVGGKAKIALHDEITERVKTMGAKGWEFVQAILTFETASTEHMVAVKQYTLVFRQTKD